MPPSCSIECLRQPEVSIHKSLKKCCIFTAQNIWIALRKYISYNISFIKTSRTILVAIYQQPEPANCCSSSGKHHNLTSVLVSYYLTNTHNNGYLLMLVLANTIYEYIT